jgi:hypothetical protein
MQHATDNMRQTTTTTTTDAHGEGAHLGLRLKKPLGLQHHTQSVGWVQLVLTRSCAPALIASSAAQQLRQASLGRMHVCACERAGACVLACTFKARSARQAATAPPPRPRCTRRACCTRPLPGEAFACADRADRCAAVSAVGSNYLPMYPSMYLYLHVSICIYISLYIYYIKMYISIFVSLPPSHPPTHRPTDPPTHRPTDPPTHRPTDPSLSPSLTYMYTNVYEYLYQYM